jgi:uncharacterized protein YecT (DUF1311 family)
VLSDPAAFVRTLYENDQRGLPDPVYGVQSREELLRTFDEPLADLIWRDLVDAQGEVGRHDAHYLYDAQDNEVQNLQVRTIENKDGRARVLATFDFPMEKGSAEFHLRSTDDGWRITNIVWDGDNGSYLDVLQSDFPLPRIEDERAEKALCGRYASYKVAVPENYDPELEGRDLGEMFANGDGVPQDFSAAIHFLCRDQNLAPAEKRDMLQHVLFMERGQTNDPLDFCAYSTSRDSRIHCAAERKQEEGPALEARYAAVRKTAGKSLDALRERATAFVEADAHWEAEQSRGGSMYAYAETHTLLDREERFVSLLEQYAKQRAPAATEAEAKRADAELNAAYRKRLAAIEPCDPEYESCDPSIPTEKDNLRAAQRAWIPYRDAWIAWYQDRWRGAASPGALRREILTALARARVAELEGT